MATIGLNTKTKEVDKKIPDLNSLFNKTDHDAKISETEGKYFATSDYNKFQIDILAAKIKKMSQQICSFQSRKKF